MAKAMHIRVGEAPEVIDLPTTPPYETWKGLVDGLIEPFDVFDGLCCYVNEESLLSCSPNRAVFATKWMEEQGFISLIDMRTPVKEGDLFYVVHGNFVIYRGEIDEEGETILGDLTDEEIDTLKERFASIESGLFAVMGIKNGVPSSEIKAYTEIIPPLLGLPYELI